MNEFVKPSTANVIVDNLGNEYSSARKLSKELGISKSTILKRFKKGEPFVYQGVKYVLKDLNYFKTKENGEEKVVAVPKTEEQKEIERIVNSDDYKDFVKSREIEKLPFEKYSFDVRVKEGGSKYAIALFSDAHIEETVKSDTVIGLNEYNIDIAEERIQKYFVNLVKALNEDQVESLVFASLGDTISGYIHEELAQNNSMTPLEATFKAQSLIYNGLEYIVKNSTVKHIKFIGIVGNHSRTTKKVQHANGHVMSYEWLMYKNVEKQIELTGLPIEVEIPNSEMAILQTSDGKKYMFMHGFQIKTAGVSTVCGIYPALNRLSLKLDRNFHQDKIYIGHFHSCISIPNATVNGSIIGFNAYSLSNGFSFEEPAQMYELFDENGLVLTRKIYCR
jgi:hypothetical protein